MKSILTDNLLLTLRLLRQRELDVVDLEIMLHLKQYPLSTAATIREALDIPRSQMSRHVLFLTGSNTTKGALKRGSDGKRLNTPSSMAFVQATKNARNAQRPCLSLTQRGSNVVTDFLATLNAHLDDTPEISFLADLHNHTDKDIKTLQRTLAKYVLRESDESQLTKIMLSEISECAIQRGAKNIGQLLTTPSSKLIEDIQRTVSESRVKKVRTPSEKIAQQVLSRIIQYAEQEIAIPINEGDQCVK